MLMPAIRTTTITGVGHWLMLDAPDRFVTALAAALDGT
jgi:pimeloyl-ACP methyl ester carboxylesterase